MSDPMQEDGRLPDLLPCPFCGGEADFGARPQERAWWSLHCDQCTAYQVGKTEAEAIATWNTRASPEDGCPSCGGLNLSCPDGCGRDPSTGELNGTRLGEEGVDTIESLQVDIDRQADRIGKLYEKLDAAVEALGKAEPALWQYKNDLHFPPEGDSVGRRLAMAGDAAECVSTALNRIRGEDA